jgi:hypothetical protein
MNPNPIATSLGRPARRRRRPHAIRVAAFAALIAAAPGAATVNAGAQPTSSPPETSEPSADAALAERALLVPEDLGDGWGTMDDELLFPNTAELARGVPECEAFAELAFDGGADHGVGRSSTLVTGIDPLFLYVVVFPTAEQASAMLEAVSTPDFDECWRRFNEVAVIEMPFGVTAASYELGTPPELQIEADAYTVKFIEGTIEIGGTPIPDTCVCAFAQVGRGVVEVHSILAALDPAARSEVVQTAIDKLAAELDAAGG